jgi:hypothetical protein
VTDLNLRPAVEAELDDEGRRRLALVAAWPLSSVSRRAQLEHGWSATRRRAVERAYRRFLALIAIDPGADYGMTQGDVDAFWHQHILDTVDYQRMCLRIFGRMVHHCPMPARRSAATAAPLYTTTTLPALRRAFGVRTSAVWPANESTQGYSKCCNHIEALDYRSAA